MATRPEEAPRRPGKALAQRPVGGDRGSGSRGSGGVSWAARKLPGAPDGFPTTLRKAYLAAATDSIGRDHSANVAEATTLLLRASLLVIGMEDEAERALEANLRAEDREELAQRALETQRGAVLEHSKVTAQLEDLRREEDLTIGKAVSAAETPLRAEIRALQERAVTTSNEMAALTLEKSKLEADLEEARGKIREVEGRLVAAELDLAVAKDEVNAAKEQSDRSQAEARDKEAEVVARTEEAKALRHRLAEEEGVSAALRGELAIAESLAEEMTKRCKTMSADVLARTKYELEEVLRGELGEVPPAVLSWRPFSYPWPRSSGGGVGPPP